MTLTPTLLVLILFGVFALLVYVPRAIGLALAGFTAIVSVMAFIGNLAEGPTSSFVDFSDFFRAGLFSILFGIGIGALVFQWRSTERSLIERIGALLLAAVVAGVLGIVYISIQG